MPPSLALALWLILLVALLRYDAARSPVVSASLWIPTVWLFIQASRLPSQWIGTRGNLEEGNSLDRAVYLVIIALALGVLMTRSIKWTEIIGRNLAIMFVLSFALLSVAWSDFPFVAFKRWFRDLGIYLGILIVVTDPRPQEAARAVLRRLGFLLIPLSILLYKYYPEAGKQYESWSGQASYVGATLSKNMLGLLCLVSGLVFVWDTLVRWDSRHEARSKQVILINLAFTAMTVWVMTLSSSATSGACFVLGCVVLAGSYSDGRERWSAFALKLFIPTAICFLAMLVLVFGIDIGAAVAPIVGRNATLTGRTDIWKVLVPMQANPLVGAGYESFWMGSRLQAIWQSGAGGINQAHNGYLQVYLNLGLVGVSLLLGVLTSSYLIICRELAVRPSTGSFGLTLWTVLVVYNLTEAAFLGGILWAALLMLMGAPNESAGPKVAHHIRVSPWASARRALVTPAPSPVGSRSLKVGRGRMINKSRPRRITRLYREGE